MHTTGILDLLAQKAERYILHSRDTGHYTMKEADGSNVLVPENGQDHVPLLLESQIDQLVDASHLVREGQKYLLA